MEVVVEGVRVVTGAVVVVVFDAVVVDSGVTNLPSTATSPEPSLVASCLISAAISSGI